MANTAEELTAAWREQRAGAGDLRMRILRSAATIELPSGDAMAYLDDVRRFVRIAYHARRIVTHLDQAGERLAAAVSGVTANAPEGVSS